MAGAMSDEELDFEDALTDQDDEEDDLRKNLLADLEPTPVKQKVTSHQPDKEHMQIFLRVRPFSTQEIITGENQGCMEIESESTLLAHAPQSSNTYKNSTHGTSKHTHKFTFSRIFDEQKTQKEFFDECMLNTVKDFIDGQNCLIFTYGVTNSGKTYTIQGTTTEAGILPRSLDVLFNSIQGRQWENMALKPAMFCGVTKLSPSQEHLQHQIKEAVLKLAADDVDVTQACDTNETVDTSKMTINSTMSEDSLMLQTSSESLMVINGDCNDRGELPSMLAAAERRDREETAVDVKQQGNIKFSVWVSFGEIYNEYIYDLLDPVAKKKSARRPTLQLREDKNGMPYIKGLKQIHVSSADEAYRLLMIGQKNLQTACTQLNHNSSRSHCIFTLKMVRVYDKKDPRMARISMLSFCDLAGAERSSKTQATGERMKEAGNINTSLLALSRCMTNLRYNQFNKDHPRIVPFRESKLTRLFQSYFSGKGRASMIVNVNQCASMFDETLHALKYSAIAKQVVITHEPERVAFKRPAPVQLAPVPPTPKRCRHTIEWATPGTMVQAMMEQVAGPANQPLPEEDEFEEDEDDESSPKVQGYLEIIEELKQQLMDANCNHMSMELQIRQEVCQEMAQQLVEIEQSLTEHHKMDKALAEEKADKRLELLKMSFQNRSRKPDDLDDDDEYIPSVLLHAEQVKVDTLEKAVEELKQQLATAGTGQQQQHDRETGGKQKKVLHDLAAENIQLKSDLATLQDKLQDTFDVAEGMAELQQVVEESQLEVESAGKRLLKRDDQLRKLQTSLTESEAETAAVQKKLLIVEDQLKRLREELDAQQQDCSACSERAQQIVELTAKLKSSSCQETKMTQMVDMLQCDSDEHRQQVEQMQSVVEMATQANVEKDKQIAQLHRSLTELEAEVKLLKVESCGAETENNVVEEQLNQRLRELTEELKEKEEQVRKLETQTKQVTEELTNERDAGVEQQSIKDSEVTRLTNVMSELETTVAVKDTEIAALTESMHQANETIRSKVLAATELSAQLNEEQTAKLQVQRQLCALQKDTDDYIVRVNEQAEEIGLLKECKMKKDNKERSIIASLKECVSDLERQLSQRLEEMSAMEDQMTEKEEELSAAQAKGKMLSEQVRVLEKQVDTQKAVDDDMKAETELTALKQQICTLETKLNDCEYKHQMSCRQMRREKSQLEKLLRETETALAEANDQIEEADFRSQESSINAEQSYSKQISDAERKVLQVTEAMVDLETCLQSSKAAEGRLCQEVDTLKERCRHLQTVVYQSEDGEKHDGLANELERCQKDVNAGEKQRVYLASHVEELKAQLDLSETCTKKQQHLLVEKDAQVHELDIQVESLKESRAALETLLSKKNTQISEIDTELVAVRKSCLLLENSLKENKSRMSEMTTEQKAAECEIQKKCQDETSKKEAKISELDAQIVQLQENQTDLKRLAAEKDTQIGELEAELTALRANLEGMSEKEVKISELTSDMASLQKLASEKDVLIQQFEAKLHNMEEDLDGKTTDMKKRVSLVERELGEARKQRDEAEASLREKELELARLRQVEDTVSSLEAQLAERTSSCTSLQGELKQLTVAVKESEDKMRKVREEKMNAEEEHRKEVGALREELGKSEDVDKLQERIDELEGKTTELVSEITRRETSIENYSKQLVALKRETELLNEQLKQSEGRESRLRSQLQQSSTRLEEQNESFTSLDKQVLTLRRLCDQHEEDAKQAARDHIKSNGELERLKARLSEQAEQVEQLEGRLKREKSSLHEQLETAREQLEKKEQKLRTRNKCVTELMEKLEMERNGFQVALKDAELNEKIIEQLKGALHEQEATMETQDVVIRNHEDEISSLAKELSEQQAKVKVLLTAEQSLQARLTQADQVIVDLKATSHDLEQQCKDVTAHDSSVERDVAELRRQLRDVTEVRRQLRASRA
ncbi:Kinesin-like protein KIF20A [Lamellibrachia satsuma]|nr:Kinesin-like protein KIF20A [Lamellibrachia satsuma]